MISYLINFDFSVIAHIFISIFLGLTVRLSLSSINQNWVNTFYYTLSFALLPGITFVITKVISGNIALSLGMIGALSIVRFRNPVKNPLELIIYFALITIGISASVNLMHGVGLTVIINLCMFIIYFIDKKTTLFSASRPEIEFEDGNNYKTIEISCSKASKELSLMKNIVNFIENYEENIFIYRLAYKNDKLLQTDLNEIKNKNDNILSINYNI
jgi:hypothetical protein